MNWDKAKNLTIVFLLILNICLGFLVYNNSTRYVLAQEAETAIFRALSQNNLTLYAQIPKSYKPMAPIALMPPAYDVNVLLAAFFPPDTAFTRSNEYDKVIYTDEEGNTLTISGSQVVYEAVDTQEVDPTAVFTKAAAWAEADAFMEAHADLLPGYVADVPNGFETREGYRLVYRQSYKGQLLYSNAMALTLTGKGVVKAEYAYQQPLKPSRENKAREIVPPDEALFTLMSHILSLYRNKETIINQMDVVYVLLENTREEAGAQKTTPCYRFWVEGLDRPYLLNAYTGVIES